MIDATERIDLLRKALGNADVGKDGVNVAFRCPNCGKSPEKKKLVVRIDNEKWHCWVCDAKGRSILGLLRKYAPTFSGEWRTRFTDERRSHFENDEVVQAERVELPECLPIDALLSAKDPDAKAILMYLENRNVDLDKSYRYRLCGGLRGKVRRRVVFPSFDAEGKLNYWTARAVDKVPHKYMNPRTDRKGIVFNEVDIDWTREVTLVEGPFDLLNAGQNAIPLLGSSLMRDSLLFRRIVENQTPVVLALDSDMMKKSHEIAKTLYGYNVRVRIAELGDNKDVGDMFEQDFKSLVESANEWKPNDRLNFLIRGISSGSIL